MNKFKQPEATTKRQSSNELRQRREELHILELLEKCTHILRDDKILIRQKIKDLNGDVLAIFRRIRRCAPQSKLNSVEMHTLQVELRKFVLNWKEKARIERLAKLKEGEGIDENDIIQSRDFKTTITDRSALYEQEQPKKIGKVQGKVDVTIAKTKRTETQRVNQQKQLVRSRSLHNYQLQINENILKQNDVLNKPKSKIQMLSRKGSLGAINRKKHEQPTPKRNNLQLVTHKTNQKAPKQVESQTFKIQQPLRTSSSSQNIYKSSDNFFHSNPTSAEKKDIKPIFEHKQNEQSSYSSARESSHITQFQNRHNFTYRFSENFTNPSLRVSEALPHLDTLAALTTSTQYPLVERQSFQKLSNWPNLDQKPYTSFVPSYISKPIQSDLFTKPELLMECRMIIEKRNRKIHDFIGLPDPIIPRYELLEAKVEPYQINVIAPQTKNYMLHSFGSPPPTSQIKPQEIDGSRSIISSEVKVKEPRESQMLESQLPEMMRQPKKVSADRSPVKSKPVFERQSSSKNKQYITLQSTPQFVFDLFFEARCNPVTHISIRKIEEVMREYPLLEILQQIGQLDCQSISAEMLGSIIERHFQPQQNSIRDIFNIIDINHRGNFTFDEYQQFLAQLFQSESQTFQTSSYEELSDVTYRFFEMADIEQTKRVSYWPFYLLRNTQQFQKLNEYLQKFEFEVEIP